MNQLRVDLYSDTQSRPSAGMRRFMLDAEVGDEQRDIIRPLAQGRQAEGQR